MYIFLLFNYNDMIMDLPVVLLNKKISKQSGRNLKRDILKIFQIILISLLITLGPIYL